MPGIDSMAGISVMSGAIVCVGGGHDQAGPAGASFWLDSREDPAAATTIAMREFTKRGSPQNLN